MQESGSAAQESVNIESFLQFVNEVENMRKFRNLNIVAYEDLYEVNGKLIIVMKFYSRTLDWILSDDCSEEM